MNVWDSKLGYDLADLARYVLRRIMKEKKQYTVKCGWPNVQKVLDENLEAGAKYISNIEASNGLILIFEKEE